MPPQTGPIQPGTVPADQFCLDLVFTDADPNDVLTLSSNVDLVLPGATFVQTGPIRPPRPSAGPPCPEQAPLQPSAGGRGHARPVTGLVQSTVWVTFLPHHRDQYPDTLLCFGPSWQQVAMRSTGLC